MRIYTKRIIELAEKYENNRKELYANHSKANGLEYDAEMEKQELRELHNEYLEKGKQMYVVKEPLGKINELHICSVAGNTSNSSRRNRRS